MNSKVKTILDSITAVLNFNTDGSPAPLTTPEPAQFTEIELKDGTKLSVDKMEAGGNATINGAPAPAGSYEAVDGKIIVVAEGGVISEVKEAAPAPEDLGTDKYAEQFNSINEKLGAYEQKFNSYEERFAKAETTISRQETVIQQLFAVVEELSKVPAGDPAQAPHQQFSQDEPEGQLDKYRKIAEKFRQKKEVV